MAVVLHTHPPLCDDGADTTPQPRDAPSPDAPASIRAITAWLRSQELNVRGEPEVQRCAGGLSHLTYRLRYADHDLVLRRPRQTGGLQRLRREFALQTALRPHFPVPDTLRLCADARIAAAPFYVMRYVAGIVPHRRTFASAPLPAADARQLCANLLTRMTDLHRIDPRALGLSESALAPPSAHRLRRLLTHWLIRHARLKRWHMPDLRPLGQWLLDHVPAQQRSRLLHNDWRLDNLVFDPAQPARIRAVLDWEFADLGDPLMDLGVLLSYWVEPGDHALLHRYQWQPSHLPGMLSRDELVQRYFELSGDSERDWPFYKAFGLFRYLLALQELHVRHAVEGGDEQRFFRGIWMLIRYLDWKQRRLIARG